MKETNNVWSNGSNRTRKNIDANWPLFISSMKNQTNVLKKCMQKWDVQFLSVTRKPWNVWNTPPSFIAWNRKLRMFPKGEILPLNILSWSSRFPGFHTKNFRRFCGFTLMNWRLMNDEFDEFHPKILMDNTHQTSWYWLKEENPVPADE